MRLQDQVYEVYRNNINENMEENRKGALAMKEALEKSPLNHNGVLEKTLQIPKVIDEQTVEQFQAITEMTIRVFDKVIEEYRKNPEYRGLFPFSKELEDLILPSAVWTFSTTRTVEIFVSARSIQMEQRPCTEIWRCARH